MSFRLSSVLPLMAVFLMSVFSHKISGSTIQGYAEMSVTAGSKIHFRVKSTADSFKVAWYRYGKPSNKSKQESFTGRYSTSDYDTGFNEIIGSSGYRIPLVKISELGPFPVIPQPPDDNDAYMTGCNWVVSCTINIPEAWDSDLYLAKLYDNQGNNSFVPVIIRSSSPGTQASIVVIASTNTWQAYNEYGGASFYTCNRPSCSDNSFIVNYDRPLSNTAPSLTGHLSGIDHFILNFLKSNGLAYEQLCDLDLNEAAASDLLKNYKVVILAGHSEYWSANMQSAIESFLDQGGKLVNLSGNTMFWEVQFDGKRMEKVKRWRNVIPGGEFGFLGAGLNGGGNSPACAGFRVLRNHWIFSNTAMQQDSLFGNSGINQHHSGCPDGSSGASGWEFDVIGPGSPPQCGDSIWNNCLELLARGVNLTYAGEEKGANMYLFHRGGGSNIFAAPSITFTGSLAVDSVLQKIVMNVLEAFLADSVPGPEESCCNGQKGDLTQDGNNGDLLDLTFLVDYIFRGGPQAGCLNAADVNGDNAPSNILDLTLLVDYIFRNGAAPGPC